MAASRKNLAQYVALLAVALAVGVTASYFLDPYFDNTAYDFMFRLYKPKPWQTQSAILAIDEQTLRKYGGMDAIRAPLAKALQQVAHAAPKAVTVDLILADDRASPEANQALVDAFRMTPNLVLASDLLDNEWEDPRPEFAQCAAALGHVHAQPDSDGVARTILLEKHLGTVRRWAMALEAFRLSLGGPPIVEFPERLTVGSAVIPISGEGRPMRVRFIPPDMPPVPRVSLAGLIDNPSRVTELTGKTVFVGVTAPTEGDRLFTPYSNGRQTTGVDINANAFETLAQGLFLTDVGDFWVLLFCFGVTAALGLAFRYLPGWMAYAGGALALVAAHVTPYVFFTYQRVFSFATPFCVAWLGFLSAAAFYHLVVRRDWRTEQAARARYQQAMHFVTHEMRTPLSTIQGSSELISRFPLTEEKRKQIAELITSESKRLARMVEIFLNVERLSAGQMELKQEAIAVKEMVDVCAERVRPLAERKRIAVALRPIPEALRISGDRELMEYACYNLLTNAVKYSPRDTEVTVSGWKDGGDIRISVEDQGIGMDQKEVKLVFQKFYRTRKAEESGEAGTGIGLSIVQQIVERHGGRIEVTSQPGAGSCFTMTLPESAAAGRN
ncbi:MAG: CHASE2 domain-containing protein [Bryobacteraceae bacterium]|jgi:signal transduction histidine kinase